MSIDARQKIINAHNRDVIITARDTHIERITKDLEDELLRGGDNVLGTTPYQRV
jgi:hypothetical protein